MKSSCGMVKLGSRKKVRMSQPQINTPDDIYKLASSFMQSRVILSAFELEIFSAITPEGSSSDQVAALAGCDPRATDRLMNALAALGLLEKKAGLFTNTDMSRRFLCKDSPDYMAGLGHTSHMWDSWSTLADAVRQGSGVREKRWTSEHTRSFIAAMHNRAKKVAPEVVSRLDLKGVKRVLDVGGGSGAFAMEFVKAGKGIEATVFDTPR
jgi:hypothetical protein